MRETLVGVGLALMIARRDGLPTAETTGRDAKEDDVADLSGTNDWSTVSHTTLKQPFGSHGPTATCAPPALTKRRDSGKTVAEWQSGRVAEHMHIFRRSMPLLAA